MKNEIQSICLDCYHEGRYTFTTMMLTLGADLYIICKLLGHTDAYRCWLKNVRN